MLVDYGRVAVTSMRVEATNKTKRIPLRNVTDLRPNERSCALPRRRRRRRRRHTVFLPVVSAGWSVGRHHFKYCCISNNGEGSIYQVHSLPGFGLVIGLWCRFLRLRCVH